MAKWCVPGGLVEKTLFGDNIDVSIDGASHDAAAGTITFTLSGRDIPDAPEVIAEVQVDQKKITFHPVS